MQENDQQGGFPHGAGKPSAKPAALYLQLTNMYVPSWGYGGPVRLLFGYARWMVREFPVLVLTGDVHHDFTRIPLKSETIEGIEIERHAVYFPRLLKRFYFISPRMWVRAAMRIRSFSGPAIVHFSEMRGMVPLYALLLKLLFGKRVTLVHSAFGSLHYKRSLRRRIYDAAFLKAFVRLVDLRLVQSEHERDAYREICRKSAMDGQSQIVLLPLHLDGDASLPGRFTDSGKNATAVKEMRREYGIPGDALVFLFLGRLHPAKGILRMMEAYREFARSSPRESLLLIVGRDDGYQRQVAEYILRNRLEHSVQIINNVYENRFDYYFLADVFLGFPTIFEETMLASIEAMACGTPIVVSREADIPYVEEERAGRVIEFDVRRAVEAMEVVTRNLDSMAVNAREVVANHFSEAAAMMKLTAVFRTAIGGGRPAEKLGEPERISPPWPEKQLMERHTAVASRVIEK